jgi:hypothetical protein
MDEATAELLSRHLDGDLAEAEEKMFQEQLAADPEMQAELASMEQLCKAVRVLAEQEEPPNELSALLEPLRRSSPPPIGVRPFYRWLAAAAALVLGVTVAVELARQNPGPQLPEPLTKAPQPVPTETGYFQLQPLPTKADNGLLGAGDHLLASPPPESELEPPPPLEVMGPLEPAPDSPDLQAEEQLRLAERQATPLAAVDEEQNAESLAGSSSGLDEVDIGETPPERAKVMTEGASLGDTRRLRSAAPETDSGKARCTMSLIVGGTEVISTSCYGGDEMPPGKHPVVVTISGGQVVSVRSNVRARADRFTDTESPSELTHSLSAMIGLSAAVADGEHNGTVWVR